MPVCFFVAGHVLVDMLIFFFAVNGLKRPAASGSVQRVFLGPGSISTIEVTKFHTDHISLSGGSFR